MEKCKICGSFAINPFHHGRDLKLDLDLCDVCYWRKRAKPMSQEKAEKLVDDLIDNTIRYGDLPVSTHLNRSRDKLIEALTGKGG